MLAPYQLPCHMFVANTICFAGLLASCRADVLVNTFRSVLALSPSDLVPAAYLTTGKIAPDYEAVELRVRAAQLSRATVQLALWESCQQVNTLYPAPKYHNQCSSVVVSSRRSMHGMKVCLLEERSRIRPCCCFHLQVGVAVLTPAMMEVTGASRSRLQ
jgi:hypothetical protein